MSNFRLLKGVRVFTCLFMKTPISYRPAAYHSRKITREGTPMQVREELRRLTDEHEQLRAWVRSLGMMPPRFSAPEAWVEDVAEHPVTDFQRELAES